MDRDFEEAFGQVDKEIARTVERITAEVRKLFAKISRSRLCRSRVTQDYVVMGLIREIIARNPELIDALYGIDKHAGHGMANHAARCRYVLLRPWPTGATQDREIVTSTPPRTTDRVGTVMHRPRLRPLYPC